MTNPNPNPNPRYMTKKAIDKSNVISTLEEVIVVVVVVLISD